MGVGPGRMDQNEFYKHRIGLSCETYPTHLLTLLFDVMFKAVERDSQQRQIDEKANRSCKLTWAGPGLPVGTRGHYSKQTTRQMKGGS